MLLKTLARPTPKVVAMPKSVTIQSEKANDMPTPISNPTLMGTPVSVHGRARPKTHRADGMPLALPTVIPSHSQTQPMVPKRILSSTPLGKNGENMDRRDVLIRDRGKEENNRKIFHPPPIEGIDIGVIEGLETLDPERRIPTEEDFLLPPPLESLLDKAKTAYKFLSK